MKMWLVLFLLIGNLTYTRSSAASGICSSIFLPNREALLINELRSQLTPYFDHFSAKNIEVILKQIDKQILKQKQIDLVQVSKVAHLFYQKLQDPFYQRIFTNLLYSKQSAQLLKTEEFTQALLRALDDNKLLNAEKETTRLKLLQYQVPIQWIKSLAAQSAINFVLYKTGQQLMLVPIIIPPIAHPTFLKETTKYQRLALFTEKSFHSILMAYFSVSLAWIMIDEDKRAEALEPIFKSIFQWEQILSQQQSANNIQVSREGKASDLISHSMKTLDAADALIAEMERTGAK